MADRRGGTLQAFSVLLYTVIPIVALFAGYYFIYVQGRLTSITERNFRFLATAGRQIETRVGGLALALKGAAEECKKVDQWPECNGSRRCCIEHSSLRQVPNLHIVDSCIFDTRPGRWLPIGKTDTYWTTDNDAPTLFLTYPATPPICARIDLQDLFDPILRLGADFFDDVVLADDSVQVRIMYQQGTDSEGVLGIKAALQDAKVAGPAAAPGVTPTAHAKDGTAAGPATSSQQFPAHSDSRAVKGSVEPEDLKFFIQPVQLERVTSGDDDVVKPAEWKLCGLVRGSRFSGETMAISPLILGVLGFILVAAVVAWPVLKLWHLGPRERLQSVDVRVLAILSVLAAGLVTFGLAEVYAYRTLTVASDQDLKAFSDKLGRNLLAELRDAYRQLAAFKGALKSGCLDGDCRSPVTYPYFTQLLWINADGSPRRAWRGVPSQAPNGQGHWDVELAATPSIHLQDRQYFRSAQASDKAYTDGLWRLSLEESDDSASTACADVAHPDKCATFAIEPVQSRASGEMVVVLAVPVVPSGSSNAKSDVAVITTPVVSLTGAVVPVGFRFAVIDDLGKVLLHLDPNRNLQENLFQECDEGPRLRAAVMARRGEFLDAQYYGWDERLYIAPLPHTPWSLVTFYDKAPRYALHSAVGMAWSIMFVLYVSAFIAAAFVAQSLCPRCRAEWLWPDRRRSYFYPQILLLILLLGVIAVALRDDTLLNVALLVTLPPLAIASLYLSLSQGRSPSKQTTVTAAAVAMACLLVLLGLDLHVSHWIPDRYAAAIVLLALLGAVTSRPSQANLAAPTPWSEPRFRAGYVGMLFLLLILLGLMPAAILFRDVYEEGSVISAKYGHWHIGRALLGRAERIRQDMQRQYGDEAAELSGVLRELLDRPLRNQPWADVYSEFSWLPSAESTDPLTPLPWHMSAEFLRHVPVYDLPGRQLRALIDDGATDEMWSWTPGAPGQLRFVLRDKPANLLLHLDGSSDLLRIESPSPSFPTRPPATMSALEKGLLAILLFLSLVVGLYVLAFVVRRLFLLDADAPADNDLSRLESGFGVWRCQYRPKANVGDNQDAGRNSVLDLAQAKTAEAISTWDEESVRGKVVSIEHFETHIADAEMNQATFSLLERLMSVEDKTILVSSAVNPLVYFSARFTDAQTDNAVDRDGLAYFRRGVRIFSAFSAPTLVQTNAAAPTTAARHWAIWSQCSTAEKLAMVQLAKEGFLNPSRSSQDVVRRLLRRGLVRRDPAFELMDDSFRDFVRSAEASETIAEWERAGGPSIWTKLRMPLLSLILLVVAFFFLTQPELFGKATGLVTAMSAIVPIVVRMFGMLTEGRSAARTDAP